MFRLNLVLCQADLPPRGGCVSGKEAVKAKAPNNNIASVGFTGWSFYFVA